MDWKDNRAVIITGLLATLLAAIPLLDLRNVFFVDWNNHLWLIEYFGECIKHLTVPMMINTQTHVGIPSTLFYGHEFYALSGLLSAFLGSAVTVRIMVFTALLLQFFQVYRAAMKTGSSQKTSMGIAIIVTWAIYPLTNLYNRGAIPEFLAVCFLTCSVSSFLCVIIKAREDVSNYDIVATGLYYVAAAITHPLTAFYGGVFLTLLGVVTLFFCDMKRKLWFLACFSLTAFFSLLILSPWLYLLYQYHDKLPVVRYSNLVCFSETISSILSRLSPFPFDLTSTLKGEQCGAVPYSDAQMTLPLILLIGVFIFIGWRGKNIRSSLNTLERAIIGVSVVILMITFTVSVYPQIPHWLNRFFAIIQFYYRLISYMNLSALVVLIILAGRISRANINSKQVINICLAFCIGISFSALILKLVHVSAIKQESTQANEGIWAPLPFGSTKHLNELPGTFYEYTGFSILDGFTKDKVSGLVPLVFANFKVSEGRQFGQTEPLTVALMQTSLVVTNVLPFPWNDIDAYTDTVSEKCNIIVNDEGKYEGILLPPGLYHLKYVVRCDGIWEILNILSWVLLIAWMVLLTGFVWVKLVKTARI